MTGATPRKRTGPVDHRPLAQEEPRICPACGRSFAAKRENVRFCGMACFQHSHGVPESMPAALEEP